MTYVIGAGDLHSGSSVAICPPSITLDGGGTYRASRMQRELWECWLDFCDNVGKLPGAVDDRLLFLNGDIGELDSKDRSAQMITRNKADLLKIAIAVLEPLIDKVGRTVIMRGTPAHTGKSSWMEEAIANDLDGVIPQDESASSWWHFRRVVYGRRFDVSHHASMGGVPWSRAEGALKIAARMTWNYAVKIGDKPPDFAVRSHNHIWGDSQDAYPVRVICLPAWTPITEHGYRIGRENDLADIGGAIIECQSKQVTKITYKMRGRVWTSLQF